MLTIEELRARLAEVLDECQAIVTDAGGNMSEEQEAKFDALKIEHDQVSAMIARREQLESMTLSTNASAGRVSAPMALNGAAAPMGAADPMCGFANMADFARAVHQSLGGKRDSRMDNLAEIGSVEIGAAPTNFHQETSGIDGFMVPPQMRDEIWSMIFDGLDLLSLVQPEPTSQNAVRLLTDEATPWGASGVQAAWRSEGLQMTASRLDTKGSNVDLNQLYAFVLATDELLEDAPRLASRLTKGAADAIRWKASDAIVSGTGAGQPLGYRNSASLVTVAKESGQAADTIVAANVAKMYSRLLPMNIGRAVWLANSDTLPQFLTMTLGDQPIWTPPATGFVGAPGGILFGRPVILSEHCETLGLEGDLHFIDPGGYYATNKVGGVSFASSIHLFFDYGVQAFRWTFRFGGQPYLSAAVSPAKGSTTKSHFVTLALRA